MKRIQLTYAITENDTEKYIQFTLPNGEKAYLKETEYTESELNEFNAIKDQWIMERSGYEYFYADSDGGEDSSCRYSAYLDLVPHNAVFCNGKIVGFFLSPERISYSGMGRGSFSVNNWGYPGLGLFDYNPRQNNLHIFFFDQPQTHEWGSWQLLKRDPAKKYPSFITF